VKYYEAVTVDFNNPPDHLLGRDPHREIVIGQTVLAINNEDTDLFGCLAEVREIKASDSDRGDLLILRAVGDLDSACMCERSPNWTCPEHAPKEPAP
jgi:hypothetical protein